MGLLQKQDKKILVLKSKDIESSTWMKRTNGWLGEEGLRWLFFLYISKNIRASKGHLSYAFHLCYRYFHY